MEKSIDWSESERRWPESKVLCRCGNAYPSHASFFMDVWKILSKKSCPGCGRTDNAFGIVPIPQKN